MRSFMQQQQHGTGIIRKAAAFLPSFPCVGLFYCSTMQQRGCSRIHTEEAAAAALAEKNKRSTGVSPMPYKSTHRGSGNTAVRTKRGEASALKDSSARGSDAPKLDNLTGSRSSCTEDGGTVPSRPLSPLQRRQLLFKHKSAFTLTPQAIRRVKYLLAQCSENQKKSPDGIRISVRRRGCSGYSYTVNYHYPHDEVLTSKSDSDTAIGVVSSGAVGKKRESDVVVVQEGVKVVVDGDALFYVIGTEMDYIVRNVEEKFTFRNPNQKFSCGCEESFMPFDADEQE